MLAALAQWPLVVVAGRPARPLHRFVSAFVRYGSHVQAYAALAANPFPEFQGQTGDYAVDLVVPAPARQRRWTALFRPALAVPPLVFASVLAQVVAVVALLGWFVATALGRTPRGMRDLAAYCIRFGQQVAAYLLFVTDRYPAFTSAEIYAQPAARPQPQAAVPREAPRPTPAVADAPPSARLLCPACGGDWGAGRICASCGQVRGAPQGVRLSSAGRRLGGFVLDVVLVTMTFVVGWLVWSVLVWQRGQTPGKQILKMRAVALERGGRPSWWTMLLREGLGKWVIGSALALSVVGLAVYFWLLWDRERQELWDKLADTAVVDDPLNLLA